MWKSIVFFCAALWGSASFGAAEEVLPWEAPPHTSFPTVRWLWPHGDWDETSVRRELQAIAEAGFGGVVIVDAHSTAAEAFGFGKRSWGRDAWKDGLRAAMEEGQRLGLRVDLMLGPGDAVALPDLTPGQAGTLLELEGGFIRQPGNTTYEGPAPAPLRPIAVRDSFTSLIYLQGGLLVASEGPRPTLDPRSLIEIGNAKYTNNVRNEIEVALDAGDWALLSYWERGAGQLATGGRHTNRPAYLVDYFGKVGAGSVIYFWHQEIFDTKWRAKPPKPNGSLVIGALPPSALRSPWRTKAVERFQELMGYEMLPYLAQLVRDAKGEPFFEVAGEAVGRFEEDWRAFMRQGYQEAFLGRIGEWARSIGWDLRAEASGPLLLPSGRAASEWRAGALDPAERDRLRRLRAEEVLSGQPVIVSFPQAPDIAQLSLAFVTGAQGVVFGSVPAEPVRVATGMEAPDFARSEDARTVAARLRSLATAGAPQLDVLVVQATADQSEADVSTSYETLLAPEGWDYGLFTTADWGWGTSYPEAPAIGGILVDGTSTPEPVLSPSTVRQLKVWAESGIPVVLCGENWEQLRPPGLERDNRQRDLHKAWKALLGARWLRQAPDLAIGTGVLRDLGTVPAWRPLEPTSILRASWEIPELGAATLAVNPAAETATTRWRQRSPDAGCLQALFLETGVVETLCVEADGTFSFSLDPGAAVIVWPETTQ